MTIYRTQTMSAAQASTNSFAIVDESILLLVPGADTVSFLVQEDGGSNGITAKIRGRYIDAGKTASNWQDTGDVVDVPAGDDRELELSAPAQFDQYAVFIKSTTSGSAGSAKVFGTAKAASSEGRRDLAPVRVRDMASDQLTTDSYAIVTESRLRVTGHNWLRYRVNNTDDTNSVNAKVRGRYLAAGGASAWADVSAESTIGTETFTTFEHGPKLSYDEYAVFVKAASAGNQGDVKVFGSAKHQPASVEDDPRVFVTRTINAESTDTITVNYQLSQRKATMVYVTGMVGAQTAAGDLAEAADAALTISDGTNGSTLQGDDTHEALFLTTADGELDVVYTDVAGASSLEFIPELRLGSKLGPIIDIHVISFDGA